MVKAKTQKLVLDGHGSFLGMEKGCFTLRNKNGNAERYPLFEKEIGEVILRRDRRRGCRSVASGQGGHRKEIPG